MGYTPKKYNPNMKKQILSEIGAQTKFGPVIHLCICVYINKWYVCMDKLLHLYLIDSISMCIYMRDVCVYLCMHYMSDCRCHHTTPFCLLCVCVF